jgi:hypothetical protein
MVGVPSVRLPGAFAIFLFLLDEAESEVVHHCMVCVLAERRCQCNACIFMKPRHNKRASVDAGFGVLLAVARLLSGTTEHVR